MFKAFRNEEPLGISEYEFRILRRKAEASFGVSDPKGMKQKSMRRRLAVFVMSMGVMGTGSLFRVEAEDVLREKNEGAVAQSSVQWTKKNDLERTRDGYRTTGADPWILTELPVPVSEECQFLVLTVNCSRAANAEIRWSNSGDNWSADRMFGFKLPCGRSTRVFNLEDGGVLQTPFRIRFDPDQSAGLDFQILDIRLEKREALNKSQLADLLDFDCITSKTHYEPGDILYWRATFQSRYYPDRASSKILDVRISDENNATMISTVNQYGLQAVDRLKELSGIVKLPSNMHPGRYTLEVISTDQRSGFKMSAVHKFGVTGPDAPFMCEIPFKYIEDFSLLRDKQGLWHIFTNVGDVYGGNGNWRADGNTRTFCHATSSDLRHWTEERPVLSITDKTYPDGKGWYENRNIWSPSIICYNDRYYMFYTTVNQEISQSISLATSDDLEHWTEYESNPVFTLEGVDWAVWRRDAWADCRDSMVFREGDSFYLYMTGQAKTSNAAVKEGVVGVARSRDLIHWTAPEIALRTGYIPESAQVWKSNGKYYMTTSGGGGYATWSSENPTNGWKKDNFPRPSIQTWEKSVVPPSHSFAEEVVPLDDGSFLVGSMTYRPDGGNTIYFSKMHVDKQGRPAAYESPFDVDKMRLRNE